MRLLFIAFSLILFFYVSCDYYVYKTKYLDVPIDHFNFNDNRTFKLRFLINDSYWSKQNGPIFFYTGNEGDIEFFAQNTGFLWESAKHFKALVVFAEHRYYGKSLPFGNLSYTAPEYFGYLTSQQALADYVDVAYYVKSNSRRQHRCPVGYICTKDVPIIAFGGSYGGMLAAWFRMKYPAIVEGALASSAPIWQFTGMTPCSAFFEVLTSVYNSLGSTNCINTIKNSWKIITDFGKNESGLNWINENWKLCPPIKTDSDLSKLKQWLQNSYVDIAMCNYPYATSFLMPLPPNPVKVICSYFNNTGLTDKELLTSIFRGISVYFNGTGTAKCLNWQTDPSTDISEIAWDIQSCMEMVMPMCTTGEDMFEKNEWNFKEVSDDCYSRLKVRPIENLIEKQYGGKRLSATSNIIFSNGLLDPWSSGGVLYNVSSSVISVVIPESAHHLDLRASNPHDPDSIGYARKLYTTLFKKWIKRYHSRRRKNFKKKKSLNKNHDDTVNNNNSLAIVQ